MVMVPLPDAQRELPSLAERALRGEEVLIAVGEKQLRLTPATTGPNVKPRNPRPGRGVWKGRVVITESFYEPWDAADIGEPGA
jgi:antitoxin (DNA-binding transcriptional repressor) of toxin-antitoxin stability system